MFVNGGVKAGGPEQNQASLRLGVEFELPRPLGGDGRGWRGGRGFQEAVVI
jgi:hypothetical protein